MIQLRILSGSMAGESIFVRHFPFHIGRASQNNLRLEDSGVWDEHLALDFQKKNGFLLHASSEAFTTINDEPQTSARLRNGDIISAGSAKIQFWLAAPRQRGLRFREIFVWILLAAVTAGQIALIYWLQVEG